MTATNPTNLRRCSVLLLAFLMAAPLAAQEKKDTGGRSVEMVLSEREKCFHVLSRLAFGPSPDQVNQLLKVGWMNWVLEQMEPEKIDNSELDEVLKKYPSLKMSQGEVFSTYRPRYKNSPPTQKERRMRNRLRAKAMMELRESVVIRAVFSKRQFQEVMVGFWRNHFNVDNNKTQVRYLANHYEQNAIRPHVFGKFEEMLMATAKHPAMLVYLDNALSQKPLTEKEKKALEKAKRKPKKRKSLKIRKLERQRGLNENYARELLELHTLGVDNGYTQRDVVECARALTGWSVSYGQNQDFGFMFRPRAHDTRPKRVLGWTFNGKGGITEGETIIRRLARHRRTAHFISFKLCRYLVNDRPSEKLVDRVAKAFLKSKGDLKQVYMAIIMSPEFYARENFRCKFKTPFEFVASALRATQAKITRVRPLLQGLRSMGQPVYECDDPTGYYDQAEAWLDPGVLVHRWNFALKLASGRFPGSRLPRNYYAPILRLKPQEMKKQLIFTCLPDGLDTRSNRILDEMVANSMDRRKLASKLLGILLGSPTFQQQ